MSYPTALIILAAAITLFAFLALRSMPNKPNPVTFEGSKDDAFIRIHRAYECAVNEKELANCNDARLAYKYMFGDYWEDCVLQDLHDKKAKQLTNGRP